MDMMEYTNVSDFDRLRAELLMFTDKSIGYVQELTAEKELTDCVRTAETKLKYAQSILMRNIIPVSLMAQSQTGKSTTTTGMLDGRYSVPCGKGSGGLRTSALPLTIYHDPHSTKIEISRYSQEELVSRIIESAGAHLDSKHTEPYDLDNQADFALLRQAVEEEIAVYRQQQNYELDRLDLLRNAILILHFYGCEAYQQLCNDEFTSLQSVKKFLSFRTDLEKCWSGLRTHGFDLMNERDENDRLLFGEMENLHVFVRDITIPVHSEFMKETGTAVIDAPGTMMSVEDTRRALKAASEAAVVLFILRGNGQLNQADKEILRTLHAAGMADKMLFAVNFRKSVDAIRGDGIEDTILAQIQEAGYCAPQHKTLLYYNALLAVRAAQGRLILAGDLDPDTEAAILLDAESVNTKKKFNSVEQAWEYTTRRVLMLVDEEDAAEELADNGLCPEILQQIEQISRWNETIQVLREFVLKNRAAGVLNDLGAQPIRNVLTSIENALEMYEKDNQRSEEDAKKAYENAKEQLDAYAEEAEKVLDDNFDKEIDRAIANDFFDKVVLGVIPDVARTAAKDVYEENGLMNNARVMGQKALQTGGKFVNKIGSFFGHDDIVKEKQVKTVQQRCAGIIKSCYEKAVAEKGTQWNAALYDTPLYERQVKKPVQRVKDSLSNLWEKFGFRDDDMLRNVDALPVDITGDLSKDVVTLKQMYDTLDTHVEVKMNVSPLVSGYMAGLGTTLGGLFWYVYMMPWDFFIPGMGLILAAVFLVVMGVVTALSQDAKDKQIEKIRIELEKSLRDEIVKNKETSIHRLIEGRTKEPGFKIIREIYVDAFKMMINTHYSDLKAIYERTKQLLSLRKEERERVAALAKEWRTEKIKPLREGVDATIEEVKRIWG